MQGNVHPLASLRFDRGPVPAALPMERMVLLLKRSPEQQQALDRFIASQYDQGSPNFHRWLSPQDFGACFGSAQQDIDTIQFWLRSHGLTVNRISHSRGALEFSGSAIQVQEAFRTEIHRYVVNGESHYANAENPQIPKALAPVVSGVLSLHNFYSRPSAHLSGKGISRYQAQSSIQPALTFYGGGNTPLHVLVADDLQTIYNAKPLFAETTSIDGSGQSIAILARSNILASDFQQYRALFQPFARMDALSVVVDGVDPGPTYGADQVESTADVEYAGAMAPNAKLLLVVSSSTFNTDGIALSALYAVENNLAPVISLSYNACEAELAASGNQFYSSLWEQAAAQGITVVVSTGDSGAAACDSPAATGDAGDPAAAIGGLAVNGLASTAFNVAVGGTQLTDSADNSYWAPQNNAAFGSALSYIPEQVWNESCSPADCAAQANLYAGGGGASNCTVFTLSGSDLTCTGHYAKPAWQSAPGVSADGARDIPDLALSAAQHDGYVLCFFYSCAVNASSGDFYFYVVGGTSLSTPEFAGVMALVDQQTGMSQGQAASTLYTLASAQSTILSQCNASNSGASFSSCIFQDVTQGGNTVPCFGGSPGCSATQAGSYGTLAGYSAGPGYDAVAGLGSVNVANLVHQWATAARTATATLLTATPSAITHGQAVNLAVTVSAESGGDTPSGDIAIFTSSAISSAQSVGYATLANGAFSGSAASLPGGSYQLTARYAGNPSFAPSLSPGVALTVQPEASIITLEPKVVLGSKIVTTLSQLPYGSLVALDFQVAGVSGKGVPTGSVSFVSTPQAGTPSTQSFALNSLGMAEWVGVESALGNFSYIATYSGDASFLPAISQTLAFQVVPASTTASLTASAASLPSTAQLQLTVNIQTESYASLTPTGTVTLLAGSSALASAPVYGFTDPSTGLAAAQAEFSLPASTLKNADNILTATYNGDSNYKNASSSQLTVTVFPNDLPLLLSLSPAGTAAGGEAFTLTVSGANFNSTSALLWNGELRPTSYVSTTQLIAAISAADLATAATNRITVANLSPNPATSSALPFAVNNTQAAAIILGSSIFNAADSSGDHALALTGIGFVDAAAVQWNGASLTATCVSPSQISATITAADFATRPAALTVSNPAGSLSRFNLQ
ncbi:MAG: protease pro-enzyme activation domain-containing protein [Candidatus Korobacteraceae bacterium]